MKVENGGYRVVSKPTIDYFGVMVDGKLCFKEHLKYVKVPPRHLQKCCRILVAETLPDIVSSQSGMIHFALCDIYVDGSAYKLPKKTAEELGLPADSLDLVPHQMWQRW